MLKLLVAVLLMLASVGRVSAAPPACWPDIPIQFSKIEVSSPELGDILYSASSVGLVWGYTCKDAAGAWHKVIAAGPWTAFPAEWLYLFDTALRGTDAERAAMWDKYATATAWDDRLKPDIDALWAKLPNPPAPVEWKVLPDPFRSDKKRLVYTVVAGRRATATVHYVDAGQPCNPATTITELGGITFMSVMGDPNLVARCGK